MSVACDRAGARFRLQGRTLAATYGPGQRRVRRRRGLQVEFMAYQQSMMTGARSCNRVQTALTLSQRQHVLCEGAAGEGFVVFSQASKQTDANA